MKNRLVSLVRWSGVLFVTGFAAACASSEGNSGSGANVNSTGVCAFQIEGTYSMDDGTVESTTCAASNNTSQVQTVQLFLSDEPGVYQMVFQKAPNLKCSGRINGCKLNVPCPVSFIDAANQTKDAQLLFALEFNGTGFSGIESYSVPSFTAKDGTKTAACVETDKVTAIRR